MIRGGPQISDSMLRWLPPIQPKDRSNVKTTYFSAEFKARVALEALSGAHTMAELAAKHNVHPNMISQWKRKAQESLPELFAKKADRSDATREAELKEVHAKIGQLTVENDFLSKAFGR